MSHTKINFKNIPVQAGIISNIINLDVNSHSCFYELDNLISSDQGVASLVLRVVNSPIYSRGNVVATIPLAVSLLGYSVVRSLALLAFSRSLFSQTKNALFRLHIWQHSLLTAIGSQSICEMLGNAKLHDEAFIAGLMHDTGKVLMFTHDPVAYENVIKYSLANNCGSIEAEIKYFGFDHCLVGLEAIQHWKLPDRFNDYMGTNITKHQPEKFSDVVLQCLTMANYLVKATGIGANPTKDLEIKKLALLNFGINEELSARLIEEQFINALMENDTYQLCASI
jgi:HD-like signal output (HDOD) protein